MKALSPFCNKWLYTGLLVASLLGCSSTPPVSESQLAAAQPVKLPRDYDNALLLMQSGDYRAAVPVLQRFIAEQPSLAGPHLNLGIAHQKLGETEASMEALTKCIELNPSSAVAHHQLGIVYREQGDFDAALNAYRTSLELDPGYALAHRNIGILYDLYLQQPGLALEHYRKYLELTTEPDEIVNRWIADLEQRLDVAQARIGQ